MAVVLIGALIIGLTLGLLGSGGSAITVPVLVYLVGHATKQSIAESMAIVGLISIAAAIPYAKAKQIDWRSVWYFGIPGMLGTFVGAWLGGLATEAIQLVVFGGVLIAAAYVMLRKPKPGAGADDENAALEQHRSPIWRIALDGTVVGIVTGFVGVGGGFLIVPALVVFGRLPMRLAIGTSLVIIALKAAIGFAKYQQYLMARDMSVDGQTVLIFVLTGVVGSLIGKSVNARMNQRLLKRVFAVFLILLGGFVIVNEGSKLALPSSEQSPAASTTEVQPLTSEASLETQRKGDSPMLLKYFYDKALAHASYMVGCQKAKVAVVVDPGRDIEQYLQMADREDVKLIAVAETHIHADYVSGARELADRIGAKLYVSDEGPAAWKYQFADQYEHQLLKDGDSFMIGNIRFDVLHTPGHTPESISFLLTDEGGHADKPMGIFTGDFVFVGSIGRPDLLEEAAGLANTAEPGARDLFHSAEKFKQLPAFLQIWPAHGAGSACGKGLGAVPSSTVGYEKLFNPSLQFTDKEEFVQYILSDQPEAPKYFAVMKRVNKEGPDVIDGKGLPESQPIDNLNSALDSATVIDLSPSAQFAKGHVPRSINIPTAMLAGWAGWVVDYSKPAYLIADPSQLPEAIRVLRKIGLDDVRGYFDVSKVHGAGLATETYAIGTPEELKPRIESGEVKLIDVRSDEEWNSGRIAGADHRFLGRLPDNVADIENGKPIVMQCQTGGRSAIAASLLQASGLEVINMTGGFGAWAGAGLPVDQSDAASCEAGTQACT